MLTSKETSSLKRNKLSSFTINWSADYYLGRFIYLHDRLVSVIYAVLAQLKSYIRHTTVREINRKDIWR